MVFFQLLANALIIGSIYALVACGFSLIYATSRFMHFAHGSSVLVSAYIVFTLAALLGLPFALSVVLTLIAAGLFGYGMHKLIYKPLKKRKSSNVILLIASVGLLILFENVVLLFFGADVKTIGVTRIAEGMNILGARITPLQITIIFISLALMVLLYIFMRKTKIGRQLRAVADSTHLAQIVGIDAEKMKSLSFVIGSVLAGIAGILIGLEQNLIPTMGTSLMVKGFTGAVIGGITSVPASILGSYVLGAVENFGIWYLPSGWKDAIAFTVLFLFLLFKPTGLFGVDKGVRK